MQMVGWVATVILAALVVAMAILGVPSIPDVQRHLRIRRM